MLRCFSFKYFLALIYVIITLLKSSYCSEETIDPVSRYKDHQLYRNIMNRLAIDSILKRSECGCGLGCFYSSARGCAACCSLGL
ncbi:hypothetical protein AB6A40_005486 [Gnathostoma spinigerum]|uniref:Uncharacterized protein n=1 Tax=Gnathostoma spinigerum TaxID=75299 RepID=A0ABD6EHS9_9BILA